MKANLNVYHFFAGAFVPFWLLSRQEIGPGAKLTYALLAQQANSRGAVQLHFRVQAAALGEDEGQLSRHLMELEEVGLIHVSRGNVSSEDIRVFFPPHVWMAGLEQQTQAVASQPTAGEAATPQRLFPEAAPPAHTPLLPQRPAAAEARPNGRGRRRGRGRRQPQSKHSFEVCLQFVTYQKEVLGHDHIWNVTGLARHLHLSGEQDDEIDAWLRDQASDAASSRRTTFSKLEARASDLRHPRGLFFMTGQPTTIKTSAARTVQHPSSCRRVPLRRSRTDPR